MCFNATFTVFDARSQLGYRKVSWGIWELLRRFRVLGVNSAFTFFIYGICMICFVIISVCFTLLRYRNRRQNELDISSVSPNLIRGYIYVAPTESWGMLREFVLVGGK